MSGPARLDPRPSEPFRRGDVLAQKYRVEGVLGRGGMGIVLLAEHLILKRSVALKVLRGDFALESKAARRLMREARAIAQMRSEHLVRIVDVGTLEAGQPYIAMEALEGMDLAVHLRSYGPAGLEPTTEWMLQACEGLAEVHSLGIVHRDIKPANLFLARGSGNHPATIKLLDFGISKLLLDESGCITSDRSLLGSPEYMSPEQIRDGSDVDARSDLWSLGVVLHELIAGWRPFDGENMLAVCAQVLADEPLELPPRHFPGEMARIVRTCLERNRGRRYQSARELGLALAAISASPDTWRQRILQNWPASPRPRLDRFFTADALRMEDSEMAAPETAIDVPVTAEVRRPRGYLRALLLLGLLLAFALGWALAIALGNR